MQSNWIEFSWTEQTCRLDIHTAVLSPCVNEYCMNRCHLLNQICVINFYVGAVKTDILIRICYQPTAEPESRYTSPDTLGRSEHFELSYIICPPLHFFTNTVILLVHWRLISVWTDNLSWWSPCVCFAAHWWSSAAWRAEQLYNMQPLTLPTGMWLYAGQQPPALCSYTTCSHAQPTCMLIRSLLHHLPLASSSFLNPVSMCLLSPGLFIPLRVCAEPRAAFRSTSLVLFGAGGISTQRQR